MFKGVVFGLSACLIWGFIFVVPSFLPAFSTMEIALGRYGVYGVVSTLIFLLSRLKMKGVSIPWKMWFKATFFSLGATFGYYLFLVTALKKIDPSICALIVGISPLTIALYGNFRSKEISLKKLILPFILIITGLVLINSPHFKANQSPGNFVVGFLACLVALGAWSWYVVANGRFLKENPSIPCGVWSTMMGMMTLFWFALFVSCMFLFQNQGAVVAKFTTVSPDLLAFIGGSLILGVLCSWLGAFLWNEASLRLPVGLTGQITIFETLFAFLFCSVVERHIPPVIECVGIVLLLSSVICSIRLFKKEGVHGALVTLAEEVVEEDVSIPDGAVPSDDPELPD